MRSLQYRHPPTHLWFAPSAISSSRNVIVPSLSVPGSFLQLKESNAENRSHGVVLVHAFDFHDDHLEVEAQDDPVPNDGNERQFSTSFVTWQIVSSSEGEETDDEFGMNSFSDPDSTSPSDGSISSLRKKKRKIRVGMRMKLGLIVFVTILLLFVDSCAWKVVRLPLDTFYLSRPFFVSAVLVWVTGHFLIPSLKKQKTIQILKRRGWPSYLKQIAYIKSSGLLVVLIGLSVARFMTNSSPAVSSSTLVTLSFVGIGALVEALNLIVYPTSRLCTWLKVTMQVAIGACFSLWLNGASISSPYSMRFLIPLPPPFGLVYLGKGYALLSILCFVSMSNALQLTDAFDGLNGGTLVLAFVGLSIAILPICCDISVFGSSMGGACLGFLLHNRYKSSGFMGETGTMAFGGGLAAMAAYSGMFFPLVISTGICLLEASLTIARDLSWETTNGLLRDIPYLPRVHVNFRQLLALYGVKEPLIIACKYCVSSLLALVAAYVGLASA